MMNHSPLKKFPPSVIRTGMPMAALAAALLVVYSVIRFPAVLTTSPTGVRSLIGVLCILMLYAGIGWLGASFTERKDPYILRVGLAGGLAAGTIFVLEIVSEYWLLPEDNTSMGLVEFGLVFAVFLFAGFAAACQAQRVRTGIWAAVWSALIGGLIWYTAVLIAFHLFNGTAQQMQVFRAEGDYEDFARSGLPDFKAWVTEDFMGAGFYHSLLLPLIAMILGTLGAIAGKALARLRIT